MEKQAFPNKRAKQEKHAVTAKPAAKRRPRWPACGSPFPSRRAGFRYKATAWFYLQFRLFPSVLWITSKKIVWFFLKICEHTFDFFSLRVYNRRMHLKRGWYNWIRELIYDLIWKIRIEKPWSDTIEIAASWKLPRRYPERKSRGGVVIFKGIT